jgi:multiple sugar transport system permease protein
MAHSPHRETDLQLMQRIGWHQVKAVEDRAMQRNFWKAFAFMSPAIILVCGLLLMPVVYNIYFSFTKWKKFAGLDEFAGISNYAKLPGNPYFDAAFYNTAIWVAASVVFPLAIGFGLAVFLRGVAFGNLFKNIIFLPRILAPTAVAVIWFHVYAPHGVVNSLLAMTTGRPVDIGWLYQDNTVTPAIIATFVWQSVGLVMVLVLLGLSAIPKDPLEAARVDGATNAQAFWHIVMPLMMPTLVVVTILSVLSGFTTFDLLWVMGVGYPGQRTLSLAVYMYFESFQKGSWAFGSAIAVIIGIVVFSVTWIQTVMQSRVDKMTR